MLLTPDKAEAQFLKKLGKAVNEVSNAIGKNDKKSSRKQKESTSRRSDSGPADSDMNSSETGNQSYGDEYVYVSIYEGKLKKGNLFSLSYEPEKYFSGYKVTPSTKTIYYDGSRPDVGPFNDGMAVMRIGQMYYFLTSSGEKIKPEKQFVTGIYSQDEAWPRFDNGRFLAKTEDDCAAIFDKQGKIVKNFGKGYSMAVGFKDGIGILVRTLNVALSKGITNRELMFVNTDGNIVGKSIMGHYTSYTTNGTPLLSKLRDGRRAFAFYDEASRSERIGFLDESNKMAIPGIYLRAHDFHEGLAAVQIKDEAGELKWGFIDTQGKTVIDFKFSNEPTDFYGGRASVYTKDGHRAILDKTGNVTSKWDKMVTDFTPDGYAMLSDQEGSGIVHPVILSIDESGNKYSFYNPSTIYVSAECIVTDKPGVLYSAIEFSPKYYDMVTLPDLEIPFTMLRYPFGDDGVTVVRDGVINDKGEYVAIFKQNEF